MRSATLSKIRIAFSIIVILLLTATFVDITHLIPEKYINAFLFFQFIPSANKFISAGVVASTGFIVIMILTILTGRTYCSFLCPLGILQDIYSRAGGKIKKRFRRYGFRKPQTFLRYSILAITLVISMTWGISFLMILDPYSIFGRTMTYFAKPVVLLGNNLLSLIFRNFDIYTFVHAPVTGFSPAAYYIPVVFFLLVGILAFVRGRLFCNSVCPVGTFLGILSKISLLRIKFDSLKCTKCGRCAIACKSSCIDFLNMEIDNSRCVGCFNCLKTCPDRALEYNIISFKKQPGDEEDVLTSEIDTGRRNIISISLLILLGLRGSSSSAQNKTAPVPKKASTVREKRTSPVSPPGSASILNFNSNCTACSLCISVCPNNVLVPSVNEYGLASIMQPYMNYHKGFCAYECVRCLEICPTGAILPLVKDAKKLTQIGKSVFIKENCIVNTEKTACGACAESCPTKAVHMVPFDSKLVIPETRDEICIGCGHCEYACPTTPYKAIFVNGNPKHIAARKPENTPSELKKPEEFPF
jgi:polyferredoxin